MKEGAGSHSGSLQTGVLRSNIHRNYFQTRKIAQKTQLDGISNIGSKSLLKGYKKIYKRGDSRFFFNRGIYKKDDFVQNGTRKNRKMSSIASDLAVEE